MPTAKPIAHLSRNAVHLASTNIRGAEYKTDLYAHWRVLYRTRNGRYVVACQGGAAMSRSFETLTRSGAVDWISEQAEDAITGYGFTREQAEIMVDGGDAGKGYRGQ